MTYHPEDFAWTAQLLRSTDEKIVKAALSNNINIILAALDKCSAQPNMLSSYRDKPIRADQETIVLIDHGDK